MSKSHPKAAANGTAHAGKAETPSACYVLSLTIENVRCFGPKQTLDLSDGNGRPAQWTIILGENGIGKTTLLQSLVGFEEGREHTDILDEKFTLPRLLSFTWKNRPFFLRGTEERGIWSVTLAVASSLTSVPSRTATYRITTQRDRFGYLPPYLPEDQQVRALQCVAYGASRRLGNSTLGAGGVHDDPAGTLFDEHATLRNAEEWLLRLDYSSSKPSEIRAQQKERLEQVKQLLISILPDVEDIRFTVPTGPNPTPRVEFQTFSGWVPLRRLGYGYQTLIAWVTDFASRMVERYPDSPDPLKEPAIVVVDEIDLHLHPMWQRKLIAFLSERFPNTQFIATAHSPLVVQAAENANLAVLRRVDDHVVIINDVDEIRGWRIDQILTSDLFGLKSGAPEVEALFDRKEKLLAKAKLNAAEKTELRELQAKIDKLPVGDTANSAKEMESIRQALELLKGHQPK